MVDDFSLKAAAKEKNHKGHEGHKELRASSVVASCPW
jgi:hypothetical protein